MQKTLIPIMCTPIMCITSIIFLANWSSDQDSCTVTGGRGKQKINFYGNLETYNGDTYTIENISVEHAFKQIKMYELPSKEFYEKDTVEPKIYHLNVNPKDKFVTAKIDLAEVAEIRAPNPEIIWEYQKDKRGRRLEFIELTLTPAGATEDSKGMANHHLIERTKKVYCDNIKDAGPEELDVPLGAIKRLTIKGHVFRDVEKKAAKASVEKIEKKSAKVSKATKGHTSISALAA